MLATEPVRTGSGADDVASLFDREAEGYDGAHDGPRAHLMRARMAVALEAVGSGPGNVLDAGMGPGRLLAELSRTGWTVSGIDISERMVALATARLPPARGRLLQGSIAELPFEDESFDAVVATGVIEYLDDPAAGVDELLRVLRPGGLAVVSMPNLSSITARWTGMLWYPSVRAAKRALPGLTSRPAPYVKPGLMRVPELVHMVKTAGASPVAIRHTGITLCPPFDLAAPGLSRRLASRLEAAPGRAAKVLAAQVVVVARKHGEAG